MGKRVPEDVCVVGAGNISQYIGFEPGYITSLDGIDAKIASKACELIEDMRMGKPVTGGLRYLLENGLHQGKTTAKRA
jgi:hypothetical protein